MNTSVKVISLDKKLVFDGLDEEFYQFSLTIDRLGLPAISSDDIYENFFQNLIPLVGPQAFSQMLDEGGFMKYSNKYSFKGSDKLSLKFFLSNNIIVVFALGEYQPSRYKIYLEGIWQIVSGSIS